ncbi:MAG: glycoside hydrolase family 15 protein [Phycisphaeraceae bacterium]
MPRDIPVGNGQMLVTFDQQYRIRDLYYPHVGQENHAGGAVCHFGVWADLPQPKRGRGERRRARVVWPDDPDWQIHRAYQPDTLATDVTLRHDKLALELRCCDVVDFHRPVLVRRIEVVNHSDEPREVRLVHNQALAMYGTNVGDTAYYDPLLRCLIHYRNHRYVMACFYVEGEQQVDEYATGNAGFNGAEGTWRDAEDGHLGNNAIAQGAVDSTMMLHVQLPARGSRHVYMVIGCGQQYDDIQQLHRFLHREGPQGAIDRTRSYWRLWLAATLPDLDDELDIPDKVVDLFKRSLLLVRSQIDNSGAIIAANDSDIMQYSRDTYSYLWPRDGAFVAEALDAAGFPDIARSFFSLCAKLLTEDGYFLHKYNPDGSPASSWHPWVAGDGKPQLPIQEDETALVLWALWRHYTRYRDIEFVRPLWIRLIQPAADFLVRYRDPATRLPLPSYDLWEERWGIHAFTVASVHAGLQAAYQFAVCFGDDERATRYASAAEELREAFVKHMWSEQDGRFLRRIEPTNRERVAVLMAEVMEGRDPTSARVDLYAALPGQGTGHFPTDAVGEEQAASFERDNIVDSSMFAIFALGLLPADDPQVEKTMQAVQEKLHVNTDVGGIARYQNDHYHAMGHDDPNVPGNPWFICTLWVAQYHIARATSVEELAPALPILEWVANHALPSGVLAEQVHPYSNDPLSVSPLTWSHATVVSTLTAYIARLEGMSACPSCGSPRRAATPLRARGHLHENTKA